MQIRTLPFFLLSTAITIVACNAKSDKKETITTDTSTQVKNFSSPTNTATPKLFCRNTQEDSLADPKADVILIVDGKETRIRSINACGDISKSEWKTYEIPDNAISACGGWWAGGGDYFYLIEKNGKFVVFEGWNEEGLKEKGFHWKEVGAK